jgi:triosephosphate isomerase
MASRRKVIGGNWKSNPANLEAVKKLCEDFKPCQFDTSKVEVIVLCTNLHGDTVREALKGTGYETGIQNISKTGTGAFTGEVTAEMAKEVGNTWALIGHSERRWLYGETIDDTLEKLKKAQEAGFKIMFACGEKKEQREAGTTDAVNKEQLDKALDLVTDWDKFVIAYEPVWAIGTGLVATPEQAQETCKNIRDFVKEKKGEAIANQVRIQYGGSSSPDNIAGLCGAACPDIDGFLVGGASLKPAFTKMIEHLNAL